MWPSSTCRSLRAGGNSIAPTRRRIWRKHVSTGARRGGSALHAYKQRLRRRGACLPDAAPQSTLHPEQPICPPSRPCACSFCCCLCACPPAHLPTCTLLAADAFGISALRIELHILHLLHTRGCGSRVIMPLATVRWPGHWYDDPKHRARIWYKVSLAPVESCAQCEHTSSHHQCACVLLGGAELSYAVLPPAAAAHARLCDAGVPARLGGPAADRHLQSVSKRAGAGSRRAWLAAMGVNA